MTPRISVVTVTLNDCAALEKTTVSVRAQDYTDIEHVVIDGGSNDGTIAWLGSQGGSQGHPNLKWKSETDRGIYDAMNKGVRMSSGHWVIFLNSGDAFYQDDVVRQIFRDQQARADLIYGDTVFVDGEKSELIAAREIDSLWQAMIFNHNSLFTKRSVLLEHPFVEQYNIVADSEFVIWAHQSGKQFFNAGVTVNTYQRGGYSDIHSVLRTVERWKLVSDKRLKPLEEINDYYFQRLLWEESCKAYLKKSYNISI